MSLPTFIQKHQGPAEAQPAHRHSLPRVRIAKVCTKSIAITCAVTVALSLPFALCVASLLFQRSMSYRTERLNMDYFEAYLPNTRSHEQSQRIHTQHTRGQKYNITLELYLAL